MSTRVGVLLPPALWNARHELLAATPKQKVATTTVIFLCFLGLPWLQKCVVKVFHDIDLIAEIPDWKNLVEFWGIIFKCSLSTKKHLTFRGDFEAKFGENFGNSVSQFAFFRKLHSAEVRCKPLFPCYLELSCEASARGVGARRLLADNRSRQWQTRLAAMRVSLLAQPPNTGYNSLELQSRWPGMYPRFGLPQKGVCKRGCNSLILRLFAFVCVCLRLRTFICVLSPFSEGLKSAFVCVCARLFAFVCVCKHPLLLHPLLRHPEDHHWGRHYYIINSKPIL